MWRGPSRALVAALWLRSAVGVGADYERPHAGRQDRAAELEQAVVTAIERQDAGEAQARFADYQQYLTYSLANVSMAEGIQATLGLKAPLASFHDIMAAWLDSFENVDAFYRAQVGMASSIVLATAVNLGRAGQSHATSFA